MFARSFDRSCETVRVGKASTPDFRIWTRSDTNQRLDWLFERSCCMQVPSRLITPRKLHAQLGSETMIGRIIRPRKRLDSGSQCSSALGRVPLCKIEDLEFRYMKALKKEGVGGWEKGSKSRLVTRGTRIGSKKQEEYHLSQALPTWQSRLYCHMYAVPPLTSHQSCCGEQRH